MIDTVAKLGSFVALARAAEWLAVDTEADSLHSYPEKLCLVQISLPGRNGLVDPLAGMPLEPLWDALRGRELLMHGADFDLRLLRRTCGFVPQAVFDTMLAARLLGRTAFGLTDLVAHYVGVQLEKGAQKADWSRRPLTPRMLAYAENDSHHLKPLADALRAELVERQRLSWHVEMCAQLVQVCAQVQEEDPDRVWRLKGADRLDRRSMAVLRELWHWREHEAVAANRPPFFVLAHEVLVGLAGAVGHGREVESIIPTYLNPRRRDGILKSVERALALPDTRWPHHLRRHGHRLTPGDKRRLEELRQRRDAHAQALGLDPSLIASRATLTALAVDWEKNQPQLLNWQRALLTG